MRSIFAAAIASTTLVVLSVLPLRAHEGHDHGENKPAPVVQSTFARGEAASSAFELTAVGRGNVLVVYLDRFSSNEPVEGATIEAETPEGSVALTEMPGDGYRLPAPWLEKSDRVDLIFTVTAEGDLDILPMTLVNPTRAAMNSASVAQPRFSLPLPLIAAGLIGMAFGAIAVSLRRRPRVAAASIVLVALLVSFSAPTLSHEGEDHGDQNSASPSIGGDLAKRLSDGSVFVPKPTQRIFAVRTIIAEAGSHKRTAELPGRVIPDPNANGYVQSAVGGRLSAPPGGFPRLGTLVKQGDVLAYVTTPLQAIDVSDIRQRQGELDQQISIVERRLARSETLQTKGVIASSQLEDTRSELEGLKVRRASLDHSRREPEALVAPITGIVADGNAVAGQIAQPNAVVFHIIDSSKLWVEALSFDAVPNAQTASAKTAGGKVFALSYRGSGFTDRSQTIPVHFAIDGELSGLRVGQFVSVLVNTDQDLKGIAIPRASLVRSSNGQDIVFEHKGAEIFIPRPVRVDSLDGDRVLAMAGIEPGMRIVTQGAELLDHVR